MYTSGRLQDAKALLERTHEEGVRVHGKTKWKHVGPVAWALATVHALLDPETDTTLAFRDAFEIWETREEEEARRIWRAGGPSPGGSHNTRIVQEIRDGLLRDLAGEPGTARRAAILQIVALTQVSNLSFSALTPLTNDIAEYGAPLAQALLEAAADTRLRHPEAGNWMLGQLRNPLRRVADPTVEAALAAVARSETAPGTVRNSAALFLLDLADIPLAPGFLASEPGRAQVDPAGGGCHVERAARARERGGLPPTCRTRR